MLINLLKKIFRKIFFFMFMKEEKIKKNDIVSSTSIEDFEKEEGKMDLETTVKNTVASLCNDKVSFTSLDISNTLKQEGIPTRHRKVRDVVRELYRDGTLSSYDYITTNIIVTLKNGDSVYATLYHHCLTDNSEYVTRDLIALPVPSSDNDNTTSSLSSSSSSSTKSVPNLINTSSVNAPNNTTAPTLQDKTRSVRSDGRLEVPSSWVRFLGWEDGDDVYIVEINDTLKLSKVSDIDINDNVEAVVKVFNNGRVIVPEKAMKKIDKISRSSGVYRTNVKVKLEGPKLVVS